MASTPKVAKLIDAIIKRLDVPATGNIFYYDADVPGVTPAGQQLSKKFAFLTKLVGSTEQRA
jgi:hypothetical protein